MVSWRGNVERGVSIRRLKVLECCIEAVGMRMLQEWVLLTLEELAFVLDKMFKKGGCEALNKMLKGVCVNVKCKKIGKSTVVVIKRRK